MREGLGQPCSQVLELGISTCHQRRNEHRLGPRAPTSSESSWDHPGGVSIFINLETDTRWSPLHETAFWESSRRVDWLARDRRECGSGTHIQGLNSAVPHHIRPQAGSSAADNDVIVYGYALCPQHLALVRVFVGVILEPNGRGMPVVGGVGAQTADVALVSPPVGRDYAATLWASGGGFCPITRR